MNKGPYLYGVTVLVHNQNLSIMNPYKHRIIRNGYIAFSIVYIILSLIGGSIDCTEWNLNGVLSAVLVGTARVHMALVNPVEF